MTRTSLASVNYTNFYHLSHSPSGSAPRRFDPTYPEDDLELVRKCANLRHLTIEMSLSNKFCKRITEGHGMVGALRTKGFGKYRTNDLLELKGWKSLHLHCFSQYWLRPILKLSDLQTIQSWLDNEIGQRMPKEQRTKTVEVRFPEFTLS